jgi:hypothetical protein
MTELEKISFSQTNLPDASYRFVTIKGFRWIGEAPSDWQLVAALIAHPSFRDHYCSGDEKGVSEEPLHGPYRLDVIVPATFSLLAHDEALSLFDEWLTESGGIDDDAEAVAASLRPARTLLDEADVCYYLPDLGDTAQHEWGHVLLHFREWIAIEHVERRLHMIACGLD